MAHGLADEQFRSYEDIEKWLDSWITSKDEHFYCNGIGVLPERWAKVVDNDGQYFEWFICNHFFTIKLHFHKKNSGNLVAHLIVDYLRGSTCVRAVFRTLFREHFYYLSFAFAFERDENIKYCTTGTRSISLLRALQNIIFNKFSREDRNVEKYNQIIDFFENIVKIIISLIKRSYSIGKVRPHHTASR